MNTLAIAVLLSFTAVLTCNGSRAPIPPHLLVKLKGMHYKNDIHRVGVTVVPMRTVSHAEHEISIGGFFGGSERQLHAPRGREGFDDVGSHNFGGNVSGVELINNPKQASNSCEQREICVPVPVDDQDASIFIFPQCIELPQCLGSCCDSFQRCHARHVVPVRVAVTKWQYDNGELREVNKTYVQMAKHMDCGCEKCKENSVVVCNENQVRKECACHCANEQEAVNCNSPWKWSNHRCKCECKLDRCADGETLNQTACKCFPVMRNEVRSRSTDISREPEVLQGNTALLPVLKAKRKSDRTSHIFH
uniref:Platelet-derived growth factor (PDGF) family profile domain-containing protein n=1 Tax=Plectus sambesii TaxID=2011161 RepID=A0A914W088_9BILA